LFTWNYGKDDFGPAIVTASDRMYSDEGLGIEYEGSRSKVLHLDNHRIILVSGDLSINSRALTAIVAWRQENTDADTTQIANAYGQIIAALSFEKAAKIVLNPLGIFTDKLSSDEFGLKKYGLPDALAINLAEQLQAASLDIEAIIAGVDADRSAALYRIDGKGCVWLHNDIGFVSIGNGGIHSSAYFMQMPYDHNVMFAGSMISTFFAKKRSEVAPGVGTTTDMLFINAFGTTLVNTEEMTLLEKAYHDEKRRTARRRVSQADNFINTMRRRQGLVSETVEQPSGETPSGNAS
jgi:hypothetical protein